MTRGKACETKANLNKEFFALMRKAGDKTHRQKADQKTACRSKKRLKAALKTGKNRKPDGTEPEIEANREKAIGGRQDIGASATAKVCKVSVAPIGKGIEI